MYPYYINIEKLISNFLAPAAHPEATGPLVEAMSSVDTDYDDTEITADYERETSASKAEQISSNPITALFLHDVALNVFDLLPSGDTNPPLDTSLFFSCEGNDGTELNDTATHDKKQP